MKREKKEIKRKRPFSLLEITLSLSILGILSTILSFEARDLIHSYQFRNSLKRCVIDLNKARSLAMSHQTDFEVSFDYNREKKGWEYRVTTDEPLPFVQQEGTFFLTGVTKLTLP